MSQTPGGIASWRLLVVDDDPDVHAVTRLAMKRALWRDRKFEISSAHSGAEGERLLEQALGEGRPFQVALIDVVMEESDSGLRLCDFVRRTQPPTVRIVLRTGQPGAAPAQEVLNDYDIDYYLEKQEVTSERLFSVVRACLRSSQDISTLLAFGQQLRDFTKALQQIASVEDLNVFMLQGLRFLETKHGVHLEFLPDLERSARLPTGREHTLPLEQFQAAGARLHGAEAELSIRLNDGEALGLAAGWFAIPCIVPSDERPVRGALFANLRDPSRRSKDSFFSDAALFIENWQIAMQAILLKQRVESERLLREELRIEKLKSLAHAVAGVAHELNTPLGVATTAASMLPSIVAETASDSEDAAEACQLILKNLSSAQGIIKKFRELASDQHFDIRMSVDIRGALADAVKTYAPKAAQREIELDVKQGDEELIWDGYPGLLTRVLNHLLENALQHAYPGGRSGRIEVSARRVSGDRFEIRVRDFGVGIPKELQRSLFDPFAVRWMSMSEASGGASRAGHGLGLAICRNIVAELLHGTIEAESDPETTSFVVTLPSVVE